VGRPAGRAVRRRDAPRGPAWTLREIAEHVSGITYYAEQMGRLG
jgi:hypothetical protein